MSHLVDRIVGVGPTFSVELWPPRTPEASARLDSALPVIAGLNPTFTSITYGAAGSTRDRTHELVLRIHREAGVDAMAHLTCASHSRSELEWILQRYKGEGISNILALKGDPPLGSEQDLQDGDFKHAIELVRLAKAVGGFTVAVAAHPEGHPTATGRDQDDEYFVAKLAEADFAITQFFFSAEVYFDFLERVRSRGADKPILPGIMAPSSVKGLFKMSEMSGAKIPSQIKADFERLAGDPASIRRLGVEVAVSLARELLDAGAPGIHIYSMNSLESTVEIHAGIADLLLDY